MSASSCWIRGLALVTAGLVLGCGDPRKIDGGDACELNSDCSSTLVCSAGKCHEACRATVDCPIGQSCVGAKYAITLNASLGCR